MRTLALIQTTLFIGLIALITLASLPAVWTYTRSGQPGVYAGALAKQFETHYDDDFAPKRFSVNLWALLSLRVFNEGRPGLVIGRDGWLFTAEEFDVADNSEAILKRNLALVDWLRTAVAQRGVALVIAIVPAKARVESAHLGSREPAALQQSLHMNALNALAASGIPAIDLMPSLLLADSASEPAFFRTDTHWTPQAAAQAANEIAHVIEARGLLLPRVQRQTYRTELAEARPLRGDLFNYLPLDPWFASALPKADTIRVPSTQAEPQGSKPPGDAAPDLFGDSATPQVILVGTSYSANPSWNFAGALQEAMGEDVANLAREGQGPFVPMLSCVFSGFGAGAGAPPAHPRLVIWEIPERALLMEQDLRAFPQLPQSLTAPVLPLSKG